MIRDTHWVEMIAKGTVSDDRASFCFFLKHIATYEQHEAAMAEIYDWCQTMFGDPSERWSFSHDLFCFTQDRDIVLFKLTWY